jgi:hypothetical protein
MSTAETEFGVQERRLVGKYAGHVVNNQDPLKLGRITVLIPGLMEPESGWCRPSMPGGGSANRGFFAPPAQGAWVFVTFEKGNPNYPVYEFGNWGSGETANFHKGDGVSNDEAPQVPEILFGDWRMTFDTRSGKRILRLKDDSVPDFRIEMDGESKAITIEAPAGIVLKSKGAIVMDAPGIIQNGRRLANNTKKQF